MITAPIDNIKLTDEHTRALEEGQSRLFALNGQIDVANRTLKTIKLETERATNDKMSQEELLAEVMAKVSSARSQLVEVEPQIVEKTAELNHLLETIREETTQHEIKKTEFSEREKNLMFKEQELVQKENNYSTANLILLRDKIEHEARVTQLKEFINNF